VTLILLAALLAGCAGVPQPETAIDTFCLTANKRSWSISDTAETIRDARAWNLLVDRRCGVPGKVASK
jgi:hypothetical protein